MNIISNSCLGAFIQKDFLKQPYSNPFCWNVIEDNSIINLISMYDTINFKKYELLRGNNLPYYTDKDCNFYLNIDNKVKVYYVHYRFSKNDTKPRKANYGNATDILYNKIWKYIIDCYEKRLQRMKDEPIFVLGSSWSGGALKYDTIKRISNIRTNYKIIMTSNIDIDFKLPSNCYYYKHNVFRNNLKLSKEVFEKYFK